LLKKIIAKKEEKFKNKKNKKENNKMQLDAKKNVSKKKHKCC